MSSPKERLQKSPQFAEVAKMLNSPLLEGTCEVAMLTFVENLPMAQDSLAAAGYHYQITGAKRFLATLKSLTSTLPEQKLEPQKQFRHDV